MKLILTGSTGFIGRHLTQALIDDGHDVYVVIRPKTLSSIVGLKDAYIHDRGVEGLIAFCQGVKPDLVFHLASLYLPEHQPKDIQALCESHIQLGVELLESLAQTRKTYPDIPCPLVWTGTAWQTSEPYGQPVNLYAAFKESFEVLLKFYADAFAQGVVALRLYDTYGPKDPRQKLLSQVREAVRQRTVLDMSSGEQKMDLLHVRDVVAGLRVAGARAQMLTRQKRSGFFEGYALRSNRIMSLRELVEFFCEVNRVDPPVRWGVRPHRPRQVMRPDRSLPVLPEWSPQVPHETGFTDFFKEM